MRVERHKTGWWIVARGSEDRPQFFSFFVDADRSAWSKWVTQAARYSTFEAAEEARQQLRERARRGRATRETAAEEHLAWATRKEQAQNRRPQRKRRSAFA